MGGVIPRQKTFITNTGDKMKWTDPDFKDLRLGFEVTAYVYVR
ncbi:pyrroloquinoline quinone precursor peptide PqqA [Marinobacter sp. LQ44]